MSSFGLKISGMDKIQAGLGKFRTEITRYLGAAGKEAGEELLDTRGVRLYPPAGPGNAPPTPYWVRGQGTQTASGNRGESQRLGTQFYVQPNYTVYSTRIGNRAGYSGYVVGDEQAAAMGRIGWVKLVDAAKLKLVKITGIYQAWVNKLIKDVGL